MMLGAKDWVLIVGIAVACLGYRCLPHGQQANAENNLSLFAQSAGVGAFMHIGFIVLGVGLLIIGISLLIPRR